MIVGIPGGEFLCRFARDGVLAIEVVGDLLTLGGVGVAPFALGGGTAGVEVFVADGGQFGAEAVNLAGEQIALGLLDGNERIGRDEAGFEIGQRTDAEVGRFRLHLLVHDQRDEEAELGDLGGDGLDV
ncbi:MAG: hypothetical protein HYV60_21955, partial [Planctomycetia bacterium]|nr:hypothetical protein [Planctomycetia bacterium]